VEINSDLSFEKKTHGVGRKLTVWAEMYGSRVLPLAALASSDDLVVRGRKQNRKE
jgi:hypothetical protein